MKLLIVCAVIAIALAAPSENNSSTNDQVTVDVYYESLCPDSKRFITTQLYPSLQHEDLSQRIKLNLYPFGKSSYTKTESNNYEFKCHHGPNECQGNKVHACAKKLIGEKPTSGLSYNQEYVGIVECLMSNAELSNPRFPLKDCGGKHKIDEKVLEEVQKCADGNDGVEALLNVGKDTNKFQEPLLSVPTIAINGEYTAEKSQEAYKDFKTTVCGYFKNKPKSCE